MRAAIRRAARPSPAATATASGRLLAGSLGTATRFGAAASAEVGGGRVLTVGSTLVDARAFTSDDSSCLGCAGPPSPDRLRAAARIGATPGLMGRTPGSGSATGGASGSNTSGSNCGTTGGVNGGRPGGTSWTRVELVGGSSVSTGCDGRVGEVAGGAGSVPAGGDDACVEVEAEVPGLEDVGVEDDGGVDEAGVLDWLEGTTAVVVVVLWSVVVEGTDDVTVEGDDVTVEGEVEVVDSGGVLVGSRPGGLAVSAVALDRASQEHSVSALTQTPSAARRRLISRVRSHSYRRPPAHGC